MRWNVLSKWSDGLDEMRHEARQVPSWLIFDVSQKKTSRCEAHWMKRSLRVLRER